MIFLESRLKADSADSEHSECRIEGSSIQEARNVT
jgi:hypothetical protein